MGDGEPPTPACNVCEAHNPKVAGSNPAPATIENEGLADATAANPFRLPRLHPPTSQLGGRGAHPCRARGESACGGSTRSSEPGCGAGAVRQGRGRDSDT